MRALFLILLSVASLATNSATETFNLDNGLKVVVREDHRAPVVVSMVWYKVGSSDEVGGSTGLAHALEHLMFKGTKRFPLGQFSKTIASIGGKENAFTNTDYTAYFEQLAATKLQTSFELEADRMHNLEFDSQEFAKEIKVIQEERRLRTDDNPQSLTYERFMAAAHLSSPYHHPVIGWMSDLKQMKVEDTKAWYDAYYAPNNATLVVVGDVIPKDVFQMAKQYFGNIKPKEIPERKAKIEPPKLGKKEVTVKAPANIPMMMMGYTVPTVKTADNTSMKAPYALEIIAGLLDSGDNGRLVNQLIRGRQIASETAIYYNLYARYQTQFILFGMPSQNQSLSVLEKAFLDALDQLKTTPVSSKELQRVKKQIIAQKVFERDSIFGQAMEIGMLETIGLDWQISEQYVKRIEAITAKDIQQVANTYFTTKNQTIARLIPEPPGQA